MKKTTLLILAFTLSTGVIFAQFDKLIGKAGNVLNKGLTAKLRHDPISTSFDDCDKAAVLPLKFGADSVKRPLCNINYEAGKGYRLQPGFYKAQILSFCLKAGTYGPSKGDGYLFAPLKGPQEALVYKLINNWYSHQEIDQHDLQLILWAIIAKTKISNLSPPLKAVTAVLLNEDDISQLSKVGLDMVSGEVFSKATASLPEPIQKVVEIENQMRSKFYQANVNYQEMENLAMLAGVPPTNSSVERGTWTLLPNGCYIKYLPANYSHTNIEIYVPPTLAGSEIYYFGPGSVAVPANTGCQRLAQSNRIVCGTR